MRHASCVPPPGIRHGPPLGRLRRTSQQGNESGARRARCRERAQNAAKLAVEGRADARGQAERAISEVATLLSQARAQLKNLASRPLRGPRATVAAVENQLQEARAALAQEDYAAVTKALNGAAAQLQAALAQIDPTTSPAGARRKR